MRKKKKIFTEKVGGDRGNEGGDKGDDVGVRGEKWNEGAGRGEEGNEGAGRGEVYRGRGEIDGDVGSPLRRWARRSLRRRARPSLPRLARRGLRPVILGIAGRFEGRLPGFWWPGRPS
jgi:hypothetical protein